MAERQELEPAGNYVLVLDVPRGVEIDGIELPDNVRQQEMVFGTVVAVGPNALFLTRKGDRIYYGPYAGKNVVLNGIEFRTLKQEQIEGYVRTVKDPSPATFWVDKFWKWFESLGF